MIPRKPGILLSAYSSFLTSSCASPQSSTSLKKRKRPSTRPCQHCQNGRRAYATIADDSHQSSSNPEQPKSPPDHVWPNPPPGQNHPTPYQIFSLDPGAAYSKARFYQLVKLYHPDRHTSQSNSTSDPISRKIKEERYRLIVAAHDILSDPTKRKAYDRFGSGWHNSRFGSRNPGESAGAGPFSQNWEANAANPDANIWKNATWEDWERFYHARARAEGRIHPDEAARSTGIYLQNSYFVLIVAILAFTGSMANFTRAQSEGQYFVDQRDIIHDRAAKELRKAKHDALVSGTRDDRVQWFLRNREATMGVAGSDPETLREEKVDRLLPDREVCKSDGIGKRDDSER